MNRKERRSEKRQQKRARPPGAATRRLLEQARAAVETGDLALAERDFRLLTKRDPLNAEPFHMLALIAFRDGRLGEAGEMILEAITRDDNDPIMHANCGAILNLLGRNMEAEAASRHAIGLAPNNPEAHNNLAVALEAQGRVEEAGEAVARAIAMNPAYAEAHINLGNMKLRLGETAAAIDAYRAAIETAPDYVMAYANLGVALREAGDLDAAEQALEKAIAINPDYAEAHNALGNVLKARDDSAGAKECFRVAIGIRPTYAEARINLAAMLFHEGDAAAAEATYRETLEAIDGLADAHAGLGVVMLATGRLEEAIQEFKKAAAIRPSHGDAQYNLATAVGGAITDEDADLIREQLRDRRLPDDDRVKLHFALGEIAEGKGDSVMAFAEFKKGNDIRRGRLARGGLGFDGDDHDNMVGKIIRAFGKAYFKKTAKWGDKAAEPVFIVGMPRSGTSLVEQIAASHPRVTGKGELDLLRVLAGDPAAAAKLDKKAATAVAADYLAKLRAGTEGAKRVTDKTPFNFFYLGLIQALFPNARVVHCVRDPFDTGFSCWRQNFTSPHAWACHLGDIGRYYRAYERLMKHWQKTLTLPILEVRYEDIVADGEKASRVLIEFLGLEWNDACLDFHKSARTVLTASNWQVRKPLYKSAVGKSKAYDQFLGPFKDALKG